MTWKPEETVDPGPSSASGWLNWVDGETKELVVLNDQPIKHTLHWMDGKGVPHEGPACGLCQAGVRPAQRYTVRVECAGAVHRWEMALLTWRDVAALAEMSGQLRGLKLRVRRSGTGRSTRYSVVVAGTVPEPELPPDEQVEAWQPVASPPPVVDVVSGSFTNGYLVAADPVGAAAYAKELASAVGTTARDVLAELAEAEAESFAALGATEQLHRLVLELEERVQAAEAMPQQSGPLDLGELLR